MYRKNAKALRGDHRRRPGAVLVWCAVLLTLLVSMVGLVIDSGLLMASYREAQNAADAAALAGVYDLIRGDTNATAATDATTFVTGSSYNNLSNVTVVINIPPKLDATYAGKANYVEAVVTCPSTTYFMQVLPGFNANQSVTAHAVAGIEWGSLSAGVLALTPTGTGLAVSGNATLAVPAAVIVDSTAGNAVAMSQNGALQATTVDITGRDSVTGAASISNYGAPGPNPVQTGVLPSPDLFSYLPTPTAANGVVNTSQSTTTLNISGTTTLNPGVYTGGISITGKANVTLNPGIYVLQGGGLNISGNASVSGSGVLFYNPGSDYNATNGGADAGDPLDVLNQNFVPDASANFGGINLSGNANVQLAPPTSGAFAGILFYQRRANNQAVNIAGDALGLSGTIYAKWAALTLSGSMTTGTQFVVNSVTLGGNGTFKINYAGANLGQAPRVYLVD